jgi:thiol-disulfide isomerase/thioredoxin
VSLLQPGSAANKERIVRRILLSVGLITVILGGAILLERLAAQAESDPPGQVGMAAPEFAKSTSWLQSEPLTMASLRGRVVVVHFWTFGCISCIHNYPAYKGWQEKYAGKGLTIVGIHTPEFEHEADVKRVRAKAEQNGLKFPIAVDNGGQNWKNWKNRYWPSVYLIDKKGKVRYYWEGELDSKTTKGEHLLRRRIEELLAERE